MVADRPSISSARSRLGALLDLNTKDTKQDTYLADSLFHLLARREPYERLFPTVEARRRPFRDFCASEIAAARRQGWRILSSETSAGIAIYATYREGAADPEPHPSPSEIGGFQAGQLRSFETSRQQERRLTMGDHAHGHLRLLGQSPYTSPQLQVEDALLTRLLEHYDAGHLPVYADVWIPRQGDLLARHGFRRCADPRPSTGAIPMLREPH